MYTITVTRHTSYIFEKDNRITFFKIGAKMIVIYPFISEHAIHSDTIIGILYSVFEN